MAEPREGAGVSARYVQALYAGVQVILLVWHCGYDALILRRGWPVYEPRAAAAAAWLMLAGVQVMSSVLLWRQALTTTAARLLSAVCLIASAVAVASYPPGQALSDVSWAWNTVGWFGVLLLMRRPVWELAVLLTLNTAISVAALAGAGALDRLMIARLIAVLFATAGVQLLFAVIGRLLVTTAEQTTRRAQEQAVLQYRIISDEAVHAGRQRRYTEIHERIRPLLRGLADQRLDPRDPVVQRRAGIEAARLRRLFAETDDTPHPLLHELRACVDVAERRDVDVTFLAYGDPPELSTADRRLLSEAPMLVLASATTWARLTVMAQATEVVVAVVADAPPEAVNLLPELTSLSMTREEDGDQVWVETRWSQPIAASA